MFEVGKNYTRNDVYEILSVPTERRKGNWETGYNEYEDDLYIFCNVGTAGRSGHDYENKWLGDDKFEWWAKENTHLRQPQIQRMLNPTGNIHFFTRSDNRTPFEFQGWLEPIEAEDTTPVMIRWRVLKNPPGLRETKGRLAELYRLLCVTKFDCVPKGEHHLREVYDFVATKYRHLCDDDYLCSTNCKSGYNSPEWKHKTRTALWDIKRRSDVVATGDERGYWVFGEGDSEREFTLVAADVTHPESERVECTTFRILRDTALARRIKRLHENRCQICGLAIELLDGATYSEAHHIQPLGSPHDGPDIEGNIIVLCPNHHAMCDYGAMSLDMKSLRLHPEHQLGLDYIEYHNSVIIG